MIANLDRNSPVILVADDDRSTRMLLRLILQKEGYQIIEVENGEECLKAYHREQPDMVLLDGMMPIMDGFACCAQLKSMPDGEKIPILMITGLEDSQSVDLAFAAGATDYITKPIHPQVLRRRLRRILEASWAQSALMESEDKYRSLVDNLKEGIFQTNELGELTFINPAWKEITEFSVYESLGKKFLDFIHPEDRNFYQEKLCLLVKNNLVDCRNRIRYLKKNGGCGWMEVYACSMLKDNKLALGIAGTINDITERKRREEFQQLEHGITKILAESVSIAIAIENILANVCQYLHWDFGEFWLLDRHSNSLTLYNTWFKLTELQPFDPIGTKLNLQLELELANLIWQQTEPICCTNWLKNSKSPRAPIAYEKNLVKAFGVPIISGEEKLGLMLYFGFEERYCDRELLKIMTAISSQIGQFIKRQEAEIEAKEKNSKLQFELKQAADYIRSLLPLSIEEPIAIDSEFIPCLQLGGDVFDYYWLDPQTLAIYLVDVAGHGVRSTLLSVAIFNLLKSQSLYNTNFYEPWTVLTELNRIFQMSDNGDDYFTIWYGVYNLEERQLSYACAGHPPAILLDKFVPDFEIKTLSTDNVPIGLMPDSNFIQSSCFVRPNTSLYIFSDGVYEIELEDRVWGINSFVELITQAERDVNFNLKKLVKKLQMINRKESFNDDISLLKITFN
jgi:sigma-B regulation protein RsbU (phosphoserine phosphatase)